jgi:hypothetical protein
MADPRTAMLNWLSDVVLAPLLESEMCNVFGRTGVLGRVACSESVGNAALSFAYTKRPTLPWQLLMRTEH